MCFSNRGEVERKVKVKLMEITEKEITEKYAHGSLHKFMFGDKEKTVKVVGFAIQEEVIHGEKETVFVVRFIEIRTGEGYTRSFTVR